MFIITGPSFAYPTSRLCFIVTPKIVCDGLPNVVWELGGTDVDVDGKKFPLFVVLLLSSCFDTGLEGVARIYRLSAIQVHI